MKFKVGDKVKVNVKEHAYLNDRGIGTVIETASNTMYPYYIKFISQDFHTYYDESELLFANSSIIKERLGVK